MNRTDPGPRQVAPHGGTLVNLLVEGAQALEESARSLPTLRLTSRTLSDLELLIVGGFSPLTGFMTRRQYDSVLEAMRLPDGTVWSMPVSLAVSREEAAAIGEGSHVALASDEGDRKST